jgi:valyl-tRNA synthetase
VSAAPHGDSDIEVAHEEEQSFLYHIATHLPMIQGYVTVATTRPKPCSAIPLWR